METGEVTMTNEQREAAIEAMFLESYKVLQQGECLFVFPEGTSHTLPHMIEIKPGSNLSNLPWFLPL